MTVRQLELTAGVFLALSAVVIAVSPAIVGDPNALAIPAALIVGAGAACAVLGGRAARRVALTVAVAGFVLDAVWLWLARDGFGKGAPWVDDLVESGILVGLFLVAVACLVIAQRRSPMPRQA